MAVMKLFIIAPVLASAISLKQKLNEPRSALASFSDGLLKKSRGGAAVDGFEGCLAGGRHHPLSLMSTNASALHSERRDEVAACSAAEIELQAEGLDGVKSSCCPAASRDCAGCAAYSGGCSTCAPGFHKVGSRCAVCADVVGWTTDSGASCAAAPCSEEMHHGMSSKKACCKCGGGLSMATPFVYPQVQLLLGASELPFPIRPRPPTAEHYSVDADCELAKYGLSVNPSSGKVVLEGCDNIGCGKEAFDVSCTVTAHQGQGLNSTATLRIAGGAFGYPVTPLLARPGQTTFAPTQPVVGATMACVPVADSWLTLSADGTLTASLSDLDGVSSGLTGHSDLGVVGTRCEVEGFVGAEKVKTTALVYAPKVWKSFTYGEASFSATAGVALLPMKVSSPDGPHSPNRFSLTCDAPAGLRFAYDPFSGVGLLEGHRALSLDRRTGVLLVDPSSSLSAVFDHKVPDGSSRKKVTLKCKAFGYYDESPVLAPRVAEGPAFEVHVFDDTCWVKEDARFVDLQLVSAAKDLGECKEYCRKNEACSHIVLKDGKCHVGQGLCASGDGCDATVYGNTFKRVPRCSETSTCIDVDHNTHGWISGSYCPVGQNGEGAVYRKLGPTTQDSLYLARWAATDPAGPGCQEGAYAFRHVAPHADFVDEEGHYIELKGKVVLCAGSKGKDVLLQAYATGTSEDGALVFGVGALDCQAPNVTTGGDDDEEEGDSPTSVHPLVLDDPSTKDDADHWMHPCDCFPTSWGPKPPVSPLAFEGVPPGSGNRFVPETVDIVEGSYVCEQEYLIDQKIIIETMEDTEQPTSCQVRCKEAGCAFLWDGEVQSTKQCRLYTDCKRLVMEVGAKGQLRAMPPDVGAEVCHVADPVACWSTTVRREFLGAGKEKTKDTCLFENLLTQCDLMLMLGGEGVDACGQCKYRDANYAPFEHKAPLAPAFVHGSRLGLDCWSERFRPMPIFSGSKAPKSLTCVSGRWHDDDGFEGLSNFACSACVQVTAPDFAGFKRQNQQELFFVKSLETRIDVMVMYRRALLRTGAFDFTLAQALPGGGKILECHGPCSSDTDCSSGLTCFKRQGLEAVPGCIGLGVSGMSYCYQKDGPRFIKNVAEDYSNTLRKCQGHCAKDADCEAGSSCMTPGADGSIRGCRGKAQPGWRYCGVKSLLLLQHGNVSLSAEDLRDLEAVEEPAELESLRRPEDTRPAEEVDETELESEGLHSLAASEDAEEAEEDEAGEHGRAADLDEDLAGDEEGTRMLLSAREQLGSSGASGLDAGLPGLGKLMKARKAAAEATNTKVASTTKTAASKTGQPPTAKFDPSPGEGGQVKLGECQGDCDADTDCLPGLKCFQRITAGNDFIPGCTGSMTVGYDYCYNPKFAGNVDFKLTPVVKASTGGRRRRRRKSPPPKLNLDVCGGHCSSDADCKSGLKCRSRQDGEDVAGCTARPKGATNVCWDPNQNKNKKLVSIDSTPGDNGDKGLTLRQCQGDCDKDSDCEGTSVCYTPVGGKVPGCTGRITTGFDYCVTKAWIDFEKKNPVASTPNDERCASAKLTLPSGVAASGLTAPKLVYIASPKLKKCQGDCDRDTDCEGHLKCFQRGKSHQIVTGCAGTPTDDWDYCYDPNEEGNSPFLDRGGVGGRRRRADKGGDSPYVACHGDCDKDTDCAAGLRCWQRGSDDDAPGCTSRPSGKTDVCYNPSPKTSGVIDSSPGADGKPKYGECEGYCTKDDDCSMGMMCYTKHEGLNVPGCSGIPTKGKGYCILQWSEYGTGSQNAPVLDSAVVVHTPYLGECEGNCVKDSQCAPGLKCFMNRGNVPGCVGLRSCGWGYCYKPGKKVNYADPFGRAKKLDYYGFVWKRATSMDEGFQVQATHGAKHCLEVERGDEGESGIASFMATARATLQLLHAGEPSAARSEQSSAQGEAAVLSFAQLGSRAGPSVGGHDAMATAQCSSSPTHRQVLLPSLIPQLLQEQLNTPDFVPAPVANEIGSSSMSAKLSDFLLTQDCGEHAVSAFGWSDVDENGRLEIFAACSQAAVMGGFEEKEAVLGGEFSFEFTTCSVKNADTASRIYMQFNRQPKVQMGEVGRKKNDKDRHVLSYKEPFERLMISVETNDGWKVCRLTAGSQEVPSPALDLNVPELPCWIDLDTDDSTCQTPAMVISGNRMQQELANARIECGEGQAITYLKKEANRFIYRCSYVAGLGACTPGQTPQVDTSSGRLDALANVQVICPQGEVLQSAVAEESSGGWWLRYRYTCCAIDGVPVAITPTGRFMEEGRLPEEGLYCPSSLDESGRPEMKQVMTFGPKPKKSNVLKYNRDELQWCIGTDCVGSDAAHPLQLPLDGSQPWTTSAIENFDSVFEGKGSAVGGSKKRARKFPELVTFGAVQPQYAEECKDDVTPGTKEFDEGRMNDVYMSLSDDNNPCKVLGGKWVPSDNPLEGPQPEGNAWVSFPYTGNDPTPGDREAGITYATVRHCADKEIQRDLTAGTWSYAFDKTGTGLDLMHNIMSIPCSMAPSAEAAPLGVGFQFETGDACNAALEHIFNGIQSVKDLIHQDLGFAWENANFDDCNSLQNGLSRVFCDLHCIRDAVKAGDKAILSSLEQAVKVLQTNMNLMLEYYSGNLQDSIDNLRGDKATFLQKAQKMRQSFAQMFTEMRGMVNGTVLGETGKVAVRRAAGAFAAKFGAKPDAASLRRGTHLQELAEHAENLLQVVKFASADRVPATSYAAMTSAATLLDLHAVARVRAHTLGIYQDLSASAKARQQKLTRTRESLADLREEMDVAAARALLVQLDNGWWEARQHLDSYLEVADAQVAAYRTAFVEFEDYTSKCSASFGQLQAHYDNALAADSRALEQLRSTWSGTERSLGALASQIVDGDAFMQLARLDASGITAESIGLTKDQICADPSNPAGACTRDEGFFRYWACRITGRGAVVPPQTTNITALVRTAVGSATSTGFTGQTWQQVGGLVSHFPMLRDRFKTHQLPAPSLKQVDLAMRRVGAAFSSASGQADSLVQEVVARLRRQTCQ